MGLHIPLDEKQYRYLQKRARERGVTVESVIADLIDADIAWQQTLADDPVATLIGVVDDELDTDEIDNLLYAAPHP